MAEADLAVAVERTAEEEARHCVRCGLCLSVCPAYRQSLTETDSPRARVALMQAVKDGLLEAPTDGYSKAFFRCLMCGACTFACPSGVAVDRILEMTRGDLATSGSAAGGALRPGCTHRGVPQHLRGSESRGA